MGGDINQPRLLIQSVGNVEQTPTADKKTLRTLSSFAASCAVVADFSSGSSSSTASAAMESFALLAAALPRPLAAAARPAGLAGALDFEDLAAG